MRNSTHFLAFLPLLATLFIASCSAPGDAPTEVRIYDEVDVQARVVSVNMATREVVLEAADGMQVELVAGPQVRNFDRVKVGDVLTTTYIVSVNARLLAADEADTEAAVDIVAAGAARGEKPAGALGAGLAMTVLVKSIDLENHIVTFTGPTGVLQAVQAEREQGRRFVEGLKPGDRVELLYVEATVLSID